MAPSSSSTKKAARLAQKGKGRRVRFQGGTLFPLVVAIVLVVGLGSGRLRPGVPTGGRGAVRHRSLARRLRVPAVQRRRRTSRSPATSRRSTPTATWSAPRPTSPAACTATTTASSTGTPPDRGPPGDNAELGVFFDNYGVEISDTKLELPEGGFTVDGAAAPEDFPLTYEEGETQCDGEDARAHGRRVGGPPRPRLEPGVHEQLRRHPVRQERSGDHDRLRPRRRRRRDAAVGSQPRGARRPRHAAARTRRDGSGIGDGHQRADGKQRADGQQRADRQQRAESTTETTTASTVTTEG